MKPGSEETACKKEAKTPQYEEVIFISEQINKINHRELWIGNNVKLIQDYKAALFALPVADKLAFVARFCSCSQCDCNGYSNKLGGSGHDFYETNESAVCTACGHERSKIFDFSFLQTLIFILVCLSCMIIVTRTIIFFSARRNIYVLSSGESKL